MGRPLDGNLGLWERDTADQWWPSRVGSLGIDTLTSLLYLRFLAGAAHWENLAGSQKARRLIDIVYIDGLPEGSRVKDLEDPHTKPKTEPRVLSFQTSGRAHCKWDFCYRPWHSSW